jgi:hypothetical protein
MVPRTPTPITSPSLEAAINAGKTGQDYSTYDPSAVPVDSSKLADDAAAKTAADRNAFQIVTLLKSMMNQMGINTNNVGNDINELAKHYDAQILTPNILQSILKENPKNAKGQPLYGNLKMAFDNKYKAGMDLYEKNQGKSLTYEEFNSYEDYAKKIFSKYGAKDILTPDVLTTIVGNDIDHVELENRFSIANTAVSGMDEFTRQQFKAAFPRAKNDSDIMKAMLLGKEKGSAWLQTKVDVADINAVYNRYNIGTDQQVGANEILATPGMTGDRAVSAITQASGDLKNLNNLADIYSMDKSNLGKETIKEATGGPASQRRAKLNALERAQFAGTSGVGSTSLTQVRSGMI